MNIPITSHQYSSHIPSKNRFIYVPFIFQSYHFLVFSHPSHCFFGRQVSCSPGVTASPVEAYRPRFPRYPRCPWGRWLAAIAPSRRWWMAKWSPGAHHMREETATWQIVLESDWRWFLGDFLGKIWLLGSKAGDYLFFVGNEDPEEAATLRACWCEQKGYWGFDLQLMGRWCKLDENSWILSENPMVDSSVSH